MAYNPLTDNPIQHFPTYPTRQNHFSHERHHSNDNTPGSRVKNPDTGIARLFSAARYSRQGLISAYRFEAAFRQEVWLAVVLIPLALIVGDSWLERAALISATILLLIVELLNSAIESVVDRFGDDYHELSGRAKDMGSAAVLLTMILLAVVWLAVLAT